MDSERVGTEHSVQDVYLRRAAAEDCRRLYEWRNDLLVRANSFHSEVIPYEDHAAWFTRMMRDPSRLQYILMADGEPAGQIRLDVQGREAEISYSIAAGRRGRGLGVRIVQLAEVQGAQDLPAAVDTLTAKVLPGNAASRRVFVRAGFHIEEETPAFIAYAKKIRIPHVTSTREAD